MGPSFSFVVIFIVQWLKLGVLVDTNRARCHLVAHAASRQTDAVDNVVSIALVECE